MKLTSVSQKWIRIFQIIGALLTWTAVGLQLYLIIANRNTSIPETIIRFFSYFTILTNIIVAVYFTTQAFFPTASWGKLFSKPGPGTAVTIYITLVGICYQVLLRHIWDPHGWQRVADELLHSVIPLYAILYWMIAVPKQHLKLNMIWTWTLYPAAYFVFVLIRGALSGFYPYYFIDVIKIGYQQALLNSGILMIAFLILSSLFIGLPKIGRGNKIATG